MMYSEIKKIFLQGGQYFLSLVIVRMVTAVNSVFIARFLLAEKFGRYSLINYLVGLLTFFAGFGFPVAVTKFIAGLKENQEDIRKLFWTSQILLTISIAVASLGYFFLSDFLANRVYQESRLGLLFKLSIPLLIFITFNSFWTGVLQGLKEIKKISFINIIFHIASVPLVILLCFRFEISGAILGLTIAYFIGSLMFLWSLSHYFSPFELNFDKKIAKKILGLSFPAFLSGLVMVPAIWLVTTKLSITKGFSEVAYFNIANTFFQAFLFLPMAIGMPLVPTVAESANDFKKLKLLLSEILQYLNFFLLIIIFPVIIFSDWIIRILYSSEFVSAWRGFVFIVGSILPVSIGAVLGYYLTGMGKMWLGFFFNSLWFFLFVGSSLSFLYKFGSFGIGIGFWFSYLFMSIAMIFWFRKITENPLRFFILLILNSVLTIVTYIFKTSQGITQLLLGLILVLSFLLLIFLQRRTLQKSRQFFFKP